ncbi:Hypothetical predicted protein [Lynx pardinus]|uniref:Uncharacterized protein n=1 Tax=Lynx pardinus TaxID=191816 RepID=A0A485NCK3_LYNPA|nr:Hypothetical predicted protein [Lynx pardinus]
MRSDHDLDPSSLPSSLGTSHELFQVQQAEMTQTVSTGNTVTLSCRYQIRSPKDLSYGSRELGHTGN